MNHSYFLNRSSLQVNILKVLVRLEDLVQMVLVAQRIPVFDAFM